MAWFGNLINWFIGYILMYIWLLIGTFLGIFGSWQVGLDGVMGAVTSFKPEGLSDVYTKDMTYQV